MTCSFGNTVDWNLWGRGSHTFDSAGKNFATSNMSTTIASPGGGYTLASAYTTAHSIGVSAGSFDTDDFTVTAGSFTSATAINRTVSLGSSNFNLTGTATAWNISATGLTFDAGTSTITFSTASHLFRTFTGGGQKYHNVIYNVASSLGQFTIVGSNYFNSLEIGPGRTLALTAGTQQTVRNFVATGQNYGYQQIGTITGQNISVPDSAATSWTGNFDLRMKVNASAWATSNMPIAAKRTTSTTGIAWTWAMNSTTRQLSMSLSNNGTTATAANSTVAVPFSDNTDGWIRVTWRASDGRLQYFTSTDSTNDPSAVTWTQLGADRTIAVGSLFDSPAATNIGGFDSNAGFLGRIYRFQARNNILDDGTGIQLDVDFTTKPFGVSSFTESSPNAATVTIAGASLLAGDGRVRVASGTPASIASLALEGPVNTLDFQTVRDIVSVIPYKYYAGANSISEGNNTNVIFTDSVLQPYIDDAVTVAGSGTSTTATFTFGKTAHPGDLLIAMWACAATAITGMTGPTGFTQITNMSNGYAWYKIADGGETSVTVSTSSSHATTALTLMEIDGFTGTPTVDATNTAAPGASVTSMASPSVTNTGIPAIAFAQFSGNGGMGNSVSVTNDWQEARVPQVTTQRTLVKPLQSSGAQTTTYTWTTSRTSGGLAFIIRDVASSGEQFSLMLTGMGT
jgi:hypothetical protein